MIKKATLSRDKKHRYRLLREWDADLPKVLFIMLNPSTADATQDDPTIRRCIRFAQDWGYGGLWVGNLFSYRTPYPKALIGHDSYCTKNASHLRAMARDADKIICAWGNRRGRPTYIFDKFQNLHCIELAKDGTPKHPLYLKKELRPIPIVFDKDLE